MIKKTEWTLNELWEGNEGQPFKVRLEHWPIECWIQVLTRAPIGAREFMGYNEQGFACGFPGEVRGWLDYQGDTGKKMKYIEGIGWLYE